MFFFFREKTSSSTESGGLEWWAYKGQDFETGLRSRNKCTTNANLGKDCSFRLNVPAYKAIRMQLQVQLSCIKNINCPL